MSESSAERDKVGGYTAYLGIEALEAAKCQCGGILEDETGNRVVGQLFSVYFAEF
ncbi:hypothetical protein [Cohnella zeiphila]|uniref:Uncharacterized protein n=1 Tax=Cohnella zeiphila TaxID=2761120 RepID=A0A7X0SH59_9BACL|nr:hypothetical protein [Cohnella zeiphila]MBB6729883.1 hypothetical protein [Cohnella zeiphila]